MTRTPKKLIIPREKLNHFCKRNHIQKLYLFGSVLRHDFTAESDVDILVEFEKGQGPGYFGLARTERELSLILNGRKVDLRTPHELSRYSRDEVLSLAKVYYAKG